RCESRNDQANARRDVREYHRIDETEALPQPCGHRIGEGGEDVRPEEERARRGEREIEALEQPQRDEGLNRESAGERIEAEERGELVDPASGGAQSGGLIRRFTNLRARQAGIK